MKKYLLSLLLVCVGFISFCSSVNLTFDGSYGIFHLTSSSYSTDYSFPSSYQVYFANYSCGSTNCVGGYCGSSSMNCSFSPTELVNSFNKNTISSLIGNKITFSGTCRPNCSLTVYQNSTLDIVLFNPNGGGTSSCPSQYTSEECQSEYSLVPSTDLTSCQGDLFSCQSSLSGCQSDYSTCNSNLSGCMTNLDNYSTSLNTCSTNLNVCNTSLSSCMSSNCPSNSGNISWSSLFVNGIQHLGAPTIRVNIPEEISRDYLSTTEDFVLDVEGYNQDTEYIESVLEVQNYTPTREDFNNTFMLFKSFSGLLVATLFVILVFYLLKKLFK